jgi:hypothetical protein
LPPRLEIDQAGQTNIRGDVKVQGKLSVKNHSIAWTPIDGTKQTVPKKPHPWQIYYAIVEAEQPATEAQQAGQPKPVLHQLRIEMGEGIHDANQLPTNQVVIGAWSPTEKIFKPCLTVSNNRSVKVHGNLIIEGRLTETQSRPEQRLTPEARNVALSSSLTGIAGASALLPKFYESKFGTPQAFLTDLLSSKETMQTLFASVQSEQQRQNFATKLVEVQNQLLQQVVVEKLITDTPTLVVAPLLKARERMQIIFAAVTAAQSTDFASQLATNQELLKAVVAELVVEPMRMQLFFAAVPAAQSADFAGQLAANAELVTAIVSELLKNKERMTLIIKGLTPAQYADFANVLATKAALLKAVTMELLTTKTRMKSLFKTIPAARYADFAELLVAESELWQVVIAKHVAAIVDSLVDTQLDTLVKQLAADQPRRQTLVTALTADETIRPELAASLWSHADDVGIKALAESLNQAGNQGESRLKAFVDSLSDERKAALKTMICGEVTPPDTPGGG